MHKYFFIVAQIALLSNFGLSAEKKAPSTWNVFGTDNRQPVASTESPWKIVGWLDTGCTGTLVGKNLVLTAAHCAMKGDGTPLIDPNLGYFYPNMIHYKANHKSHINHVWWGTSDPNKYRKDDWAILRLDDNLGDIYGWMGVSEEEATTVTLVTTNPKQ